MEKGYLYQVNNSCIKRIASLNTYANDLDLSWLMTKTLAVRNFENTGVDQLSTKTCEVAGVCLGLAVGKMMNGTGMKATNCQNHRALRLEQGKVKSVEIRICTSEGTAICEVGK